MTPKENKLIQLFYPNVQWKLGQEDCLDRAERCVVIADEFAIGFAEWCDDNYFRMGNTSFWAESMDWDNDNKFTTKELLEIYKETLWKE